MKVGSFLFIGNSYTYYNDMPTKIFREMAESAGCELEVEAITHGSYTLERFSDRNDEEGARVYEALTGNKSYDYVIVQEQSKRPALEDVPLFYTAARKLVGMIRAKGATPVFYSTWGRKTGSAALEMYSLTNETMTWKVAASYEAIAEEMQAPVAYVGLAFYDVYTSESGIDLYDRDRTHPSYAGSYLAAATILAQICRIDPRTLTYTGELSAEDAAILREAAWKAVFETPTIPKEYKTEARGVGEYPC